MILYMNQSELPRSLPTSRITFDDTSTSVSLFHTALLHPLAILQSRCCHFGWWDLAKRKEFWLLVWLLIPPAPWLCGLDSSICSLCFYIFILFISLRGRVYPPPTPSHGLVLKLSLVVRSGLCIQMIAACHRDLKSTPLWWSSTPGESQLVNCIFMHFWVFFFCFWHLCW